MHADYDRIRQEIIRRRGEETDHLDIYWEQYSDKTHFIYELLQNAEDVKATKISFRLNNLELQVFHNGRVFMEDNAVKDVTGICDIKMSTKSDDLTRIGKLGMGFKLVYAYTDVPKIFSGEECFRIEKLIRPYYEKAQPIPDGFTTLFILPFKQESVKEAYAQICERLSDIGIRTMLFLRHIREIEFEIYNNDDKVLCGCYLQDTIAHNNIQTIKLIGEKWKHNEAESILDEENWLVFSEKIPLESDLGEDHPKVSAAFLFVIENGKKYIKRAQNTYLNVFFPTHEKTGLGFILQGPYKTTPNRSEIPPKDPWNKGLIELTKKLVHNSLAVITENRIVEPSRQFITALRINEDSIRDEMRSLFSIVTEGVLNDLKSLSLLPADDDTFTSAKNTRLPETTDVRKLLQDCLPEYFGVSDPVKWISRDITADSEDTRPIFDFLQKELNVVVIRFDSMCRQITDETSVFLKNRINNINWFVDFYKSLNGKAPLKNRRWEQDRDYGWMRTRSVILTSDNKIVPPFNDDDSNNVFLPMGDSANAKTVHTKLLKDKEIVEFFDWLKIVPPDFLDEIERNVFPKYTSNTSIPMEENVEDIQQMLTGLANTDNEEKKKHFIVKLSEINFLIGIDADLSRKYCKPFELFLDSILKYPSGLSEFSNIHGKWEVIPQYKEHFLDGEFVDFLHEKLGIMCQLSINETSTQGNPLVRKEGFERYDTCISEDYFINDIEKYLEKNKRKASLLIWNTITKTAPGVAIAKYRANASCKIQEVKSQLVQYLESHEWISTKTGGFKKPEDMTREELPSEFNFDENNGLLRAIGFGRKQGQTTESFRQKQAFAAELGTSVEEIETLKNMLKVTGLTISDLIAKVEFSQSNVPNCQNFPRRKISDLEQVQDKMSNQYDNTDQKTYTQQTINIRTSQRNIDPETWLKETYKEDEKLVCQICKQEMPFKKPDGNYYFEKREISINTKAGESSFSKESDEQYLALCPVCAAKYMVYVQKYQNKMKNLCETIKNAPTPTNDENTDIPVLLDSEQTITFVAPHLARLQTILRRENDG
jgi:hypothetical protein